MNFNQVWWDLGNSIGRTSLITDPPNGQLPPLTPERQAYDATPEGQRRKEYVAQRNGCLIDREALIRPSSDNDHLLIVQVPGYVVFLHEKVHSVRIIPVIDRAEMPAQIRQWLGVSRGRWRGDSLIVETTQFDDRADLFGSGANHHVVEEFTRVADGGIQYARCPRDARRRASAAPAGSAATAAGSP